MKKRTISSILIFVLSFSFLFSCSKSEKQTAESFQYFDTYSTLTVYCDEQEFLKYSQEFKSTLKKYHELFDIYNNYEGITNLKSLNEQAKKAPVNVSDELFNALAYSKELCSLTKGKFNPALGAITSIWHEVRSTANDLNESISFPSKEAISAALSHTDPEALILDSTDKTVFFKDAELLLDLGGIAKGYVASLLSKRLIELGCESFLLNLGGNVIAQGTRYDGSPWSIGIENPFDDKSLGFNEPLALSNSTLVTSGSYQRFFKYNDKVYSHIIDTETGYPSDRFSSVSVLAPSDSSGLADALSTALFCMSYEDGLSLIEKTDGVSALWVFNDGSYKASPDFGGVK